jgi:hypothetical protein
MAGSPPPWTARWKYWNANAAIPLSPPADLPCAIRSRGKLTSARLAVAASRIRPNSISNQSRVF